MIVKLQNKTIYCFSDSHFGAGDNQQENSKFFKFQKLLKQITDDQNVLFILGDLFDFWFEFDDSIPENYKPILKELKAASDKGLEIHFIGGNHDWWTEEQFLKHTGAIIYKEPITVEAFGVKFFMAHGDGFAQSDWGYRNVLKPILRNPIDIWLFKHIPVFMGQKLARLVSNGSKIYTVKRNLSLTDEYIEFAKKKISEGFKFVIFGHTHEPAKIVDLMGGKYINSGDFFQQYSYLEIKNGIPKIRWIT